MEVHPDVLKDMADGKTVPTKYGDWQIAWMAGEILRLRQQLDGQTSAFNSRHDEIEQARSEVERLRGLLRDECIGHDDGCRCKSCVAVFAAAGRGEGKR